MFNAACLVMGVTSLNQLKISALMLVGLWGRLVMANSPCQIGHYTFSEVVYRESDEGELRNLNREIVRVGVGSAAVGVVLGGLARGPLGLAVGGLMTGMLGGQVMRTLSYESLELYKKARPLSADQNLLGIVLEKKFQQLVHQAQQYLHGQPAGRLLKTVYVHQNAYNVSHDIPLISLRDTAVQTLEFNRAAELCGYKFASLPEDAKSLALE